MYPIKMRTMECIGFFTTHILYFVAGGFRVVCQAATENQNKIQYLEVDWRCNKHLKRWLWDWTTQKCLVSLLVKAARASGRLLEMT